MERVGWEQIDAEQEEEGPQARALHLSSDPESSTAVAPEGIDLEDGLRPDALLFGESHGRAVVSTRRRHLTRLRELATRAEVPIAVIGEVRGRRLEIGELVALGVDDMHTRWSEALEKVLAENPPQ